MGCWCLTTPGMLPLPPELPSYIPMNNDTFTTDAGQDMVRDSARKFAEGSANLKAYRARRQTLPGLEPQLVKAMADMGWFGTLIPEAHGGMALPLKALASIVEELGKSLLAEPLVAVAGLAARALVHGDNEALKARLLPALASGERLIALAWQEEGTSIDPLAIATRAKSHGNVICLSGRKRFVAGGAAATGFLVTAMAADGLAVYWVDATAPGLTISHEWRADGSPATALVLDGVQVDASQCLACGARAEEALARAIDEAAVLSAAELLGVMTAALDITLEYMRTRVQFDRPIGSFQALQHRAADLYLQRELAAAALSSAIATLDTRADATARQIAASRAKSRCSEAGMRIARDAIQLHGAMGFTDECDAGLYLKRTIVLSGWLGNATVHKARVSRLRPGLKLETASAATATADAVTMKKFDAMIALPVGDRDWNALTEDEFRHMAAEFFATRLPAELRFLSRRPLWLEVRPWYEALSHGGWLAPSWPTEHGGMGLEASKLMVYHEEMGRSGAPRHLEQGINYIGPLLIARGTAEQKAFYLPRILTGEHRWCQGYSEPNAGSDLASLRTAATLDGDAYVVDGEKIWTTMAHQATHMYALVRTDKEAKKHAGISMLILDMTARGIGVRPIRNIVGHEELCQVLLDKVRTPKANLIGDLNDGWKVSRTLLGFERNTVGSPRTCLAALERLEIAMRTTGEDSLYGDRLTQSWLDVADLATMYERFVQAVRSGANPGFEVSVMKIWATETLQGLTELLIEVLGEAGTIAGPQDFGGTAIDVLAPFLDSRSTTISAGSSQVQRNVIAKRVLHL